MAEPIRLGMVGFGNIGTGVARHLHARQETLDARMARPMRLARIADLDLDTPREAGFDYSGLLTDRVEEVLEATDIDVAIELVGGYEPARSFVERALKAGKHVVTANKAMLARFGPELVETARDAGVSLLFEASVGGGIPIIRTLQQGLVANELRGVYGILNGTTNYILTQMANHGTPFDEALADAQARGYAEPDPTFDIEGIDTAHKTAVLAWLAFGRPTRDDEVYAEGITQVTPGDLAFAAERGYAVKMLGVARRGDDGAVEARAHPVLASRSNLLASVDGVYNAVMVDGEPIGPTLYYGQGAGPDATASAVISDCAALADAIASGGLDRESRLVRAGATAPLCPMDELTGAYFVRASGEAVKALEGAGIPVVERQDGPDGLRVLTGHAREGDLKRALASVGGAEAFFIRVLPE